MADETTPDAASTSAAHAVSIATTDGATGTKLFGIGAYRPQRIVDNEEVCQYIDSSDEWIQTRSGIKTRRYAGPEESVVMMATAASRKAIANSSVNAEDIDVVIMCTSTYENQVPHGAPKVASQLGRNGIAAFDLTAGCAGFGYGLAVATNLIRGGAARYALVIGVERMMDGINKEDRNTAFIFGDGAAAVIVGPSEHNELSSVVWGSDGEKSDAIRQTKTWVELMDEGARATGPVEQPYLVMDGSKVFRWAAYTVSRVAEQTLQGAGVSADQIQAFIPHQANGRINEAMAKHLGLPDSVVVANDIEHTGNTSAASIPLAMENMLREGLAKEGDLALCIGFGAGLSYAGQVVKLPPAPKE